MCEAHSPRHQIWVVSPFATDMTVGENASRGTQVGPFNVGVSMRFREGEPPKHSSGVEPAALSGPHE